MNTFFATLHVNANHFILAMADPSCSQSCELDPFAGEAVPLRAHVNSLYSLPADAYQQPPVV